MTLEQIAEIEAVEKTRARNLALAEELGVLYNSEAVEKELEKCRVLLASQEKASLYGLTKTKLQERNALLQRMPAEPMLALSAVKWPLEQCKCPV